MSSNSMDLTATQMVWRPKLIRLTQILHPEFKSPKAGICYIDPGAITAVFASDVIFSKQGKPDEKHDPIEATAVFYCHGTLFVHESPEEVALLREKAYGHEPEKLKAIS